MDGACLSSVFWSGCQSKRLKDTNAPSSQRIVLDAGVDKDAGSVVRPSVCLIYCTQSALSTQYTFTGQCVTRRVNE